jgi:AAA15 family ATPase/GTPase
MAKLLNIALKNFKGIDHLDIDLSQRNKSPVITLVGLNESGKTTILEGISYFVTGDNALSSMFDRGLSSSRISSLIPIHKKAAFTGSIEISSKVEIDATDLDEIIKMGKEHNIDIHKDTFPTVFSVKRRYDFEDSSFQKGHNLWNFIFKIQMKKNKFEVYKRPEKESDDLWLKIADHIEDKLPRVAYFPTFLVDMPPRIYTKEHKDEKAVNRY